MYMYCMCIKFPFFHLQKKTNYLELIPTGSSSDLMYMYIFSHSTIYSFTLNITCSYIIFEYYNRAFKKIYRCIIMPTI